MRLPLPLAPLGLIALCAVLGAGLLYQLAAPPAEIQPERVAIRTQPAVGPPGRPFVAPPFQQFSEIDERPVFSPLRQPVASPQFADSSGTGAPSDFVLVGIIMGTGRRIAVVKTPGPAPAQNVSVGGTINQWRITRIEPNYIVVQGNSGDQDIKVPLHPNEHAGAAAVQPEQ
jgi:hypothetical protein